MDLVMVGVLVGSVVAFFAGVAIVVANVVGASFSRAGVSRSLQSIDTIYGASTADADRSATVLGSRVAQLGRAATPGVALARIRRLGSTTPETLPIGQSTGSSRSRASDSSWPASSAWRSA